MRLCGLVCFALVAVGMGAAQDSNFSAGPQYLMNYGSPMFYEADLDADDFAVGAGGACRRGCAARNFFC